jgi:hypothetical protein
MASYRSCGAKGTRTPDPLLAKIVGLGRLTWLPADERPYGVLVNDRD